MGKLIKGRIGVPKHYFLKMAKADYRDYREALAREFYQNSIDAGATLIEVTVDIDNRQITVVDNGHGMTLDVLQNKLLVLGGSHKAEGSTGAFGKAKEVLFFSWDKYWITTNGLHCTGEGEDYTIQTGCKKEKEKGTVCTIRIQEEEDMTYLRWAFVELAKKFQTDCAIKIDGTIIKPTMLKGALVEENEWCKIYHNRERHRAYASIRINGQWMFKDYHGHYDIGEFVIELAKSSVEMLTSNRDGFKHEYSSQYQALMKQIIVERETFLRPKKEVITQVVKGEGKNRVNWNKIKEAVCAKIKNTVIAIGGSEKSADTLGEYNLKVSKADLIKELYGNSKEATSLAEVIESRLFEMNRGLRSYHTLNHCSERIAFVGYKPDFVLNYYRDDMAKVLKFTTTKRSKILVTAWTEVVKQVLLDTDFCGEYTCGFDFRTDNRASIETHEGAPLFSINPHLLLGDFNLHPDSKKRSKNPYSNRSYFMHDLKMLAVHEIAHLKYSAHDVQFAEHRDYVESQTWRSESTYKAIISAAFKKR